MKKFSVLMLVGIFVSDSVIHAQSHEHLTPLRSIDGSVDKMSVPESIKIEYLLRTHLDEFKATMNEEDFIVLSNAAQEVEDARIARK